MTMSDALEPRFATVLADHDGHCRWVARVGNYDTGDHRFELLITLAPDGSVTLATRPLHGSGCTWSPPIDATRR